MLCTVLYLTETICLFGLMNNQLHTSMWIYWCSGGSIIFVRGLVGYWACDLKELMAGIVQDKAFEKVQKDKIKGKYVDKHETAEVRSLT